jgi:hypothetical protein
MIVLKADPSVVATSDRASREKKKSFWIVRRCNLADSTKTFSINQNFLFFVDLKAQQSSDHEFLQCY